MQKVGEGFAGKHYDPYFEFRGIPAQEVILEANWNNSWGKTTDLRLDGAGKFELHIRQMGKADETIEGSIDHQRAMSLLAQVIRMGFSRCPVGMGAGRPWSSM